MLMTPCGADEEAGVVDPPAAVGLDVGEDAFADLGGAFRWRESPVRVGMAAHDSPRCDGDVRWDGQMGELFHKPLSGGVERGGDPSPP